MLFLVISFWGQHSFAASCTSGGGGNWSPSGSLTYQRDQPIGTWGSNKFGTSAPYQFSCIGDSGADRDAYLTLSVASAPVPGYTDVYPTNNPGVGVRYNYAINSGSTSFCPVQFDDHIVSSVRTYTCHIPAKSNPVAMSFGASVEFVKLTNTVASGMITYIPAVTVSYSLNNQSGTWNLPIMWNSGASVNLLVVACAITTPNVNVPLAPVLASSFTAINSTKGDYAFTIGLSCDAGARINASLSFTQNTDTSNISVINLTGAGNQGIATGVGIQLLYGSTPLQNNTNVVLKTSSGGQEFPVGAFVARYFQTKSVVTTGDANATATLNLTYQ